MNLVNHLKVDFLTVIDLKNRLIIYRTNKREKGKNNCPRLALIQLKEVCVDRTAD